MDGRGSYENKVPNNRNGMHIASSDNNEGKKNGAFSIDIFTYKIVRFDAGGRYNIGGSSLNNSFSNALILSIKKK